VRGLAVFGSRARPDGPNDEWSDLDLILIATDPERLLGDESWLGAIARPWVTLVHEAPIPGIQVRQVLFEGALDADIVILPTGVIGGYAADPGMAAVFAQGFRLLVDRDGELAPVAERFATTAPASGSKEPPAVPDAERFDWVVRDFLFQSAYTVKKLARGELWVAKDDCDGYLKHLLLTMIEWHAAALGGTGAPIPGGGRYMERWADPAVVERLRDAYATYDAADVARALLVTMELFADITRKTAAALGFDPTRADEHAVAEWIRHQLAALGPTGQT
jgi:aminoglycoside 6-adenylyltransferase